MRHGVDALSPDLGPAHANNGLANVPFRPQCKEEGAPFGRAKLATPDAAMRAERHVPLIKKSLRGAGRQKGRSPRHAPREYIEYSLRRNLCARPFWRPAPRRSFLIRGTCLSARIAASGVACLARPNGAPSSSHCGRKGTFASPLLA